MLSGKEKVCPPTCSKKKPVMKYCLSFDKIIHFYIVKKMYRGKTHRNISRNAGTFVKFE